MMFKDELNLLAIEDSEVGRQVAALLPNQIQVHDTQLLEKDLEKFHGVSLLLQKHDGCINLYDVQMLFERLIFDFGGAFEQYLSPNADIIDCPKFEAAIVKCIKGMEPLTDDEKVQLKCFEVETLELTQNEVEELNSVSYGIKALLEGRKWQRIDSNTTYIVFKLIPITSNVVKRYFSNTSIIMTTLWNYLHPSKLENILFLKIDSSLMSMMTIQKAINAKIILIINYLIM